jgi:hypothetical protein
MRGGGRWIDTGGHARWTPAEVTPAAGKLRGELLLPICGEDGGRDGDGGTTRTQTKGVVGKGAVRDLPRARTRPIRPYLCELFSGVAVKLPALPGGSSGQPRRRARSSMTSIEGKHGSEADGRKGEGDVAHGGRGQDEVISILWLRVRKEGSHQDATKRAHTHDHASNALHEGEFELRCGHEKVRPRILPGMG